MIGSSGTSTGVSSDLTNLASSTNDGAIGNNGQEDFSVEWIGYFYTGDNPGVWTFSTASDDGSFLWLGTTATSGYTTSNCLVCNGDRHAFTRVSNSITLAANTFYPIRILYGQCYLEGYNHSEFSSYFETPNGVEYYNGNEFYTTTLPGMECIHVQIIFLCFVSMFEDISYFILSSRICSSYSYFSFSSISDAHYGANWRTELRTNTR
jgi:hypothetical protein